MKLRWTNFTATKSGVVVLWSKHLIKWRGRRVDLHKIKHEDTPGCFHSHPANAIRIILRGAYWEELEDGRKKRWSTGMIGYVPGPLCHRIHAVGLPCYTLWIRGKDRFKLRLIGYGKEERVTPSAEHQEDPD